MESDSLYKPPLPPQPESDELLFTWRRAFRKGRVTRGDLMDAFGIKETTATLILREAVGTSSGWLVRRPRWVEPLAELADSPPTWASARALFDALDEGDTSFARTGLDVGADGELTVEYVNWTSRRPQNEKCLDTLLQAIVSEKACRIRYVGLRRGECARWRLVWPLAFERMGDQWRLIAQDLEDGQTRPKSFVLPRISGTELIKMRLPDDVILGSPLHTRQPVRLNLSAELTEDQKAAIRHELKFTRKDGSDDSVQVPVRSVHDFITRFAGVEPSPDVVWPVLSQRNGD